jgi:hypothetical protein
LLVALCIHLEYRERWLPKERWPQNNILAFYVILFTDLNNYTVHSEPSLEPHLWSTQISPVLTLTCFCKNGRQVN